MFAFRSDGTLLQSNPDGGNVSTSDSAGMGLWRVHGVEVEGGFMEINADRQTRAFVSTGVIRFTVRVEGDRLIGSATASFYAADGTLLKGPLPTPLSGRRFTL